MEIIDRTYNELIAPSANQLRVAVLRAGGQISQKEARDYVARQADKQLFAKASTGGDSSTATRDEKSDLQADLIDLKQFGGNMKVILIAINPWNRRIAMEGLPSKSPAHVTIGFRAILQRMDKPQVLSTDQGLEWSGPFNRMLEEKGILHRYKGTDTSSRNQLGVLDRAIQTVKLKLFQKMTRANSTKWDGFIQQTEAAMNQSMHGALIGSPNDTEGDSKTAKIARFQLMKDNAAKFESNHEIAEKKMDAVREAGQFRVAKKSETFDRSFKPSFQNEIRAVREVKAGQVTDSTGKVVPVSSVKPVPQGTKETTAPDFRGRGLRDARLKEDLKEFAKDLYDALGDEEIALTSAARLMPPEFAQAKPTTLLFSQFLALFPNLFKVSGVGPRKKVKRVGRRLRGKQPVQRS